jgi:RHS repeat-associated protein
LALVVEELEGYAALRGADGRGIAFDVPALGDKAFNRLEKMSLLRDERGYGVLDHGLGLAYRFGPARPDGVRTLAAVENANSFAITFTYDGHGHLAQVVDSAKRQFTVHCDETGHILSIITAHPTEPRQRVTLVTYNYNSRGELISAADALDQTATYQYQEKLLLQETFKNGLSFYFEYVGQGPEARCTRTWGDEGIYDHKLVYDLDARRTVVTNSLGYATTYLGNENGLVEQVQDARGGVTSTEYNTFNEVLSETDPLGLTTRYEYNERGNCLLKAMPDGARMQYEYDQAGHLLALTDAVGGGWQWTYSDAGLLICRSDPRGQTMTYTYQEGRLKTVTDVATHRATTLSYDAGGNLLELQTTDGQQSRWLYDGWGRMRKSADARGNVQWREHDLLGRVLTVHEPDGNVRRFAYDGLDNVTQAQDRHAQVQYAYRGLGRLIRRVEAGTAVEFLHDTEEQLRAIVNEHGLAYRFELDGVGDVVIEAGFDGLTRRYQRDAGGRVVALKLPTGQRTHYRYDPVGRVTQVQYSDGSMETYAYRADGALLAAGNETTTVAFTRDGQGQVLQEQQGEHTLSSAYDDRGQRSRLRSSLGADVQYTHDWQGAVTQMQAGSWQALFERDAQGLEVQRTLSSGVRMRSERDSFGRLREQRISVGLGGRQSGRTRSYGWQAGDRLAQIQDSQHGLTHYEHDAVGNLTATTYGDGTQELRLPDAVGNLFTRADQKDRRYGPAGELLEAQGTRYTYDALGNLSSKTTAQGQQWHYAWNAAGHLSEVVRPDGGIVRFTYDALGRRVSKRYQGRITRWVWDGNNVLHEWQELEVAVDNVDELVTWLFEEDSFTPAAKLTAAGSYSVVADHLGTPLALYDAQGQATWEMSLNSYGQVRQGTGKAHDCPFRYQGQYEDQETGLCYNRFRYYDPYAGQYISQDPITIFGGYSLYGYVTNPSSWIDPLGLQGKGTGGAYMFGFENGKMYIGKGESGRMDKSIAQRTAQVKQSPLIGAAHISTGGDNELGKIVEHRAMVNAGFTKGNVPANYLNSHLSGQTAWDSNPNLRDKAKELAEQLEKDFKANVEKRKGVCPNK